MTQTHLDAYCERTGPEFWAEPLNAVSNAAFLIAAFLAWRMLKREGAARELHVLPAILFAIGIGSFLYHTFHDRLTLWMDVLPILAFQLAAIALMLRRLYGLRWWGVGLAWAVFLAGGAGLQWALRDVPTHGSSGYLAALLVLLGFTFLARRHGRSVRAFALASGCFVLSLALRTLDLSLCHWVPSGLHWLWHCLNAAVLYFVIEGCMAFRTSGAGHG